MKPFIVATTILAVFLTPVYYLVYEWDLWSYTIGIIGYAIYSATYEVVEEITND